MYLDSEEARLNKASSAQRENLRNVKMKTEEPGDGVQCEFCGRRAMVVRQGLMR